MPNPVLAARKAPRPPAQPCKAESASQAVGSRRGVGTWVELARLLTNGQTSCQTVDAAGSCSEAGAASFPASQMFLVWRRELPGSNPSDETGLLLG